MKSIAVLVALCARIVLGLPPGASVEASRQSTVRSSSLLSEPAVQAAVRFAEAKEERVLTDQIELCQIPAPPFRERARAQALKRRFEALGLRNVSIDEAGNVIGTRVGNTPRPRLVVSAHLDTVFPDGTDVRVTRQGSLLKGPGIGDDCRGLAVLLGIARSLEHSKVTTEGPITFVGTVGEEGLGDLRGVKHLFSVSLKGQIDRFVSIDGTGLGITHRAVGSHRYRVTFTGPGGHSYGHFGVANPIHALGRAIARIGDLTVPQTPRTTFSVGRIGGGTSINAIASDSWMEVDLRSSDPEALRSLDSSFREAVTRALIDENSRWGDRGKLSVAVESVGERPAGGVSQTDPIVQRAVAATSELGLPIDLNEGSTDANVPMSLGIPAICIDGGGRGTGAHSPGETFDATESWKGTQRALLVAIALSQPW